MIGLIGREISVLKCLDPAMVGISGSLALESMHTLTVVSGSTRFILPKVGTILQLRDTRGVVLGDEMEGRLTDRIARGSKV